MGKIRPKIGIQVECNHIQCADCEFETESGQCELIVMAGKNNAQVVRKIEWVK